MGKKGGGGGGHKQYSAQVRKACEDCDVDAAILAARRASRENAAPVMRDALNILLITCVRAGELSEATTIAQYAQTVGVGFSLVGYGKMLQSFLSRTDPKEALVLLTAVKPLVTDFASPNTAGYFFHFARLNVDEYLTEASTTYKRVAGLEPPVNRHQPQTSYWIHRPAPHN